MEPKLFLRYSSDLSAFITGSMSASFSAQGSHCGFLTSSFCDFWWVNIAFFNCLNLIEAKHTAHTSNWNDSELNFLLLLLHYSQWENSIYNIASRATQSNSVYVSVLQISTVLADGVSKLLCQNFFLASGHCQKTLRKNQTNYKLVCFNL